MRLVGNVVASNDRMLGAVRRHMSSAIELHDSRVRSCVQTEGDVTISLSLQSSTAHPDRLAMILATCLLSICF